MRLVFLDAEFTGEHAATTLVSLGLVTIEGDSLSVTFNDYDRDQVTPWLEQNVLAHIDESESVDSAEGFRRVSTWLAEYAAGDRISLVSAGKMSDLLLLFELWHAETPDRPYFHALHCLPDYLNHAAHFDLPTIMFLAGFDPAMDRAELAGTSVPGVRHEAVHDALLVRECFLRCVTPERFPMIDVELAAGLRAG